MMLYYLYLPVAAAPSVQDTEGCVVTQMKTATPVIFLEQSLTGTHPSGGPGGPDSPLGAYSAIYFHGFFSLNYVICNFTNICVRNMFAMWEDRASLQQGSRLTLS